jgi:protein-S-isoprenylcysteine O-methyltransferase Ste14
MDFRHYKPPKNLRFLFILHYAPLLLIILIGPQTVIFNVWKLPTPQIPTLLTGVILFIIGTIIYFKWEFYWDKHYHGQLVTSGIFEYIRHPHYTSLLIIGYGLGLFFTSTATVLLATIAVPLMILSIYDEEKHLLKQYGKEYKQFMKQTPYRIIPKLF